MGGDQVATRPGAERCREWAVLVLRAASGADERREWAVVLLRTASRAEVCSERAVVLLPAPSGPRCAPSGR
ncbi:hypothetical protein DT076_08915 [Desertihabitans brevis]|uniref:Uncharacterized protein n=1 Tax=Desertihabitans brevis TaxID=2268447 RepID=A0A367YXB4_9ACTN|nr:hypothetical protein DT076_08915 [Desertihabitans brevis]